MDFSLEFVKGYEFWLKKWTNFLHYYLHNVNIDEQLSYDFPFCYQDYD